MARESAEAASSLKRKVKRPLGDSQSESVLNPDIVGAPSAMSIERSFTSSYGNQMSKSNEIESSPSIPPQRVHFINIEEQA